MKKYVIYFQLYGKKLKTTIKASSMESAKEIIKSKIIFDKIEEKSIESLSGKDIFGDIFKNY